MKSSKRPSFNSTLVRLKGCVAILNAMAAYLFQFHTGSIKRRNLMYRFVLSVRCFNSTLVRLKGDLSVVGVEPQNDGFQFHTGSIKS